jgi:dTDP-4-amino-4,6-dideoxygalactose transaminase
VISLADPGAENRSVRAELDAAIAGVIDSGRYVLGPNNAAFEAEMAAYLGVRHATGVASGTDALVLALLACGVGPGDDVVVPALSFVATAEAVMRTGATPIFADVRADSYGLDPDDLARRITPATKAVVPVHLFGNVADMPAIMTIARERGLVVVEDNAQAHGATLDGRQAGALGDVGCFSFFPTKNLGGLGDGGMVVGNDAQIDERVRVLRAHGSREKNRPETVGMNSRLDELQAAILRVKLRHLDTWNARRREIAVSYSQALGEVEGIELPAVQSNVVPAFHLYTVRLQDRPAAQRALEAAGVASAVYYPLPLPLTELCADLGCTAEDFPVTSALCERVLSVPVHAQMSDTDAAIVARALGAPA